MSSGQIAAPHLRIPRPVVAAVVAAAFALGALTGFGLERILAVAGEATRATGAAVAAQTFTGVADNSMSEAARRATYGSAVKTSFTGVADNNMSDAARRALLGHK